MRWCSRGGSRCAVKRETGKAMLTADASACAAPATVSDRRRMPSVRTRNPLNLRVWEGGPDRVASPDTGQRREDAQLRVDGAHHDLAGYCAMAHALRTVAMGSDAWKLRASAAPAVRGNTAALIEPEKSSCLSNSLQTARHEPPPRRTWRPASPHVCLPHHLPHHGRAHFWRFPSGSWA